MAKIDILTRLRSKNVDFNLENFDAMMIPYMWNYLYPQDVEYLHDVATSLKLSAKIDAKYKMIGDLMLLRGFKRFAGGTNRVVYKFLEDDRFVVKVAIDKVGCQANLLEYKNQQLLKPFVSKTFYVSQCGTVCFAERVLPITRKAEFKEVADCIANCLVYKILGKYVVDDVGTEFFMNWGIRAGTGPVLLDYPYVYPLDGAKLVCNQVDQATGIHCDGKIDYDWGFNQLMCYKCGRRYYASDLRDENVNNKLIIIKGGKIPMKVTLVRGDEEINQVMSSSTIVKPNFYTPAPKKQLKVVGVRYDQFGNAINDTEEQKEISSPPAGAPMDEDPAHVVVTESGESASDKKLITDADLPDPSANNVDEHVKEFARQILEKAEQEEKKKKEENAIKADEPINENSPAVKKAVEKKMPTKKAPAKAKTSRARSPHVESKFIPGTDSKSEY